MIHSTGSFRPPLAVMIQVSQDHRELVCIRYDERAQRERLTASYESRVGDGERDADRGAWLDLRCVPPSVLRG